MSENIVFISDFFAKDVLGGAELNNEELILILKKRNFEVLRTQSHLVDREFIEAHADCFFIISNFTNIRSEIIDTITDSYRYVVYEHDHKYLRSRDPANYPNFKAPPDKIINLKFYQNARSVYCQSSFHSEIVKMNTGLQNIINVSGNLWSEETLSLLEEISLMEKENCVSIMNSSINHKNTQSAVRFCQHKSKKYCLVSSGDNRDFLRRLGENDTLVFFPSTPETLCRVVCEARMMGMKVITNDLVGATKEEWFSLKGKELVDVMREKRDTITNLVIEAVV